MMFINDVNRKEEIRTIAIEHLKKLGVKYRVKKSRAYQSQLSKHGKKFFKTPLQCLEVETVTLKNGQQLAIPKRIHELCSVILLKVQTEGIFRKEGSKARQNEIKLLMDRGCTITDEHHVIDLAVILKYFLRELPDSLIPQELHELFLRCSIIENKLEALLLACLLLPSENLNVLSYIMQFFHEVASYSLINKMNFSNLSILIGPNILPVEEKVVPKSSLMLLIENSSSIGVIPDDIIDQIEQKDDERKKKNRRRSGSLTRMFNGLKKIVTSKTESETANCDTPDLLLTPNVENSRNRKRKSENGISLKKKKEILTRLPDCTPLNTPFKPIRTPISKNPNGSKNKKNNSRVNEEIRNQKDKKVHWYSMKNIKDLDVSSSLGSKSLLERRWSVVSNVANFRKKNRNSCGITVSEKELIHAHNETNRKRDNDDFITVPKVEYEEFKNRISAIERRISIELDNIDAAAAVENDIENDNNFNKELNDENNIENVQLAYRQTLESASSLSPTTDKVVKRLSRDLRIRRSGENKIFRSPSERRIGSLKRRSSEKKNKINRHKSWHVNDVTSQQLGKTTVDNVDSKINEIGHSLDLSIPRLSTRMRLSTTPTKLYSIPFREIEHPSSVSTTSSVVAAAAKEKQFSFHVSSCSSLRHSSRHSSPHLSNGDSTNWMNAESFFNHNNSNNDNNSQNEENNSRASLAKLRKQNVGMVKAKARIFDNAKDDSMSPIESHHSVTKNSPLNVEFNNFLESPRNSYRNKTRFNPVKSKNTNATTTARKHKLQQIGRQYIKHAKNLSNEFSEDTLNISTPYKNLNRSDPKTKTDHLHSNMPYVKTPLTLKTPKRLCRTPRVDKRTPFKVLATPM